LAIADACAKNARNGIPFREKNQMTTQMHESVAEHAVPAHLEISIRFPAATKPFVDPHASRTETVGALKVRVLAAFAVSENSGPDGQTLYFLYYGDARLEDSSQTLGEIAGDKHALKLKLVQQLIQG
jgi:hypothetical protein